jgi:hypothetical protein
MFRPIPQGGPPTFADDLLYGAAAIATFMFGDKGDEEDRKKKNRRKIYALAENGHIPFFYIGKILCSRKSSIVNSVAARERAAASEIATSA